MAIDRDWWWFIWWILCDSSPIHMEVSVCQVPPNQNLGSKRNLWWPGHPSFSVPPIMTRNRWRLWRFQPSNSGEVGAGMGWWWIWDDHQQFRELQPTTWGLNQLLYAQRKHAMRDVTNVISADGRVWMIIWPHPKSSAYKPARVGLVAHCKVALPDWKLKLPIPSAKSKQSNSDMALRPVGSYVPSLVGFHGRWMGQDSPSKKHPSAIGVYPHFPKHLQVSGKMEIPPKSSNSMGFSIVNSPFGGNPHCNLHSIKLGLINPKRLFH